MSHPGSNAGKPALRTSRSEVVDAVPRPRRLRAATNDSLDFGASLPPLRGREKSRSRRRGNAPAWAVKLAAATSRVNVFLRQTLPEYVRTHRQEVMTGSVSFAVHLLVALILAIWIIPRDTENELFALISSSLPEDEIRPEELEDVVQPETLLDLEVDSIPKKMLSDMETGLTSIERDDVQDRDLQIPLDVMLRDIEIPVDAGDFGGRSSAGRRAGVNRYGGTAESEKAVNAGLKWLQSVQQPDGSWSFGKVGDAGSPGQMQTTDMGATSLALLCFLGAGHRHLSEGPYQKVVASGINWMKKSAVRGTAGADLRGQYQGNSGLYVQGIATICLCEACAMEPGDKELRKLAIEAVQFVERSQDPVGGGWRYQPRQRGDTSVVGWQLMALQSAKAGGLRVSGDTLRDGRQFLNSVQTDGGAAYGYMRPEVNRPAMTAVGLLCRMYMGWKRDHDALQRGVHRLAALGPSPDDIYHNYYATQVLRHYGGELWDKWNIRMRQQLIETQVSQGPGAGSWDVTDPHGRQGGRIYQTALSILTLEVYYRHLPLYRDLDRAQASAELKD